MPAAADVTPGKWSQSSVLFDNGEYSVISGLYENNPALGERWNGEGEGLGFPNQSGYPVWHVVPEFLEISVLRGLLDELLRTSYLDSEDHIGHLLVALRNRIQE